MSSYYTSPFELERRRLAGIVSQCERDLNAAIDEVCSQRDRMQEATRQQKEADAGYKIAEKAAERAFAQQQSSQKRSLSDRKAQLQHLLDDAQLEIRVLEQRLGRMEEARQRQMQLGYRLQNARDNFDALEGEIRTHIARMEAEVRRTAAEQNRTEYADLAVSRTTKQRRAVALSMNLPLQESEEKKRRPQDLFAARMEAVMASSCAARIPSAAALAREFAAQPEYAKIAFAVKNMQKLEELELQVEKMEKATLQAEEKREHDILEYRALCKMLQIRPDEQLIRSGKGGRRLAKLCEEMKQSYQERKKHAYVAAAVEEVMRRRGILFQDAADTAGGSVMEFSMDHASVFVSGLERERLVMEVGGVYDGEAPSLNERRQAAQTARHFCSLLAGIEEELREEFGICFGAVTSEEPSEETILMQKDISRAEGNRYTEGKKEMTLQRGE